MTPCARLLASRLCGSRALYLPRAARTFSSEASVDGSAGPAPLHDAKAQSGSPNRRWLAVLRARLNKILETSPEKSRKAAGLLQDIDRKWLDLIAGPEGFSTHPQWMPIHNREIIWGDMDSMVSHVNNLVYNRLAESGRVNWVRGHALEASSPEEATAWRELVTPLSIGLILRNITTTFKFPMTYPDSTSVIFKLAERPHFKSDRLELEAAIFSSTYQRLAAHCVETNVIYDYRVAKKTILPGFMVERFQDSYDKLVQTTRNHQDQALQLVRDVAELEAAKTGPPVHGS